MSTENQKTQLAPVVTALVDDAQSFEASEGVANMVKIAMKETVKHAKLNQKHETSDVRSLSLASFALIEERILANQLVEIRVIQSALYTLSGIKPGELREARAKVGMRVTRGTSAALLAVDKEGFRLNKIGDLEAWEKHNTPMLDKLDRFDHVIGKVPNTSKKWEPVAQPSYREHFGVQYPGSVNRKGADDKAKKAAAAAASMISSYESMTVEFLVSCLTGANALGKPPKAENLPTAVLKRSIEIMTALNHYQEIARIEGHNKATKLFSVALEDSKNKDPALVAA